MPNIKYQYVPGLPKLTVEERTTIDTLREIMVGELLSHRPVSGEMAWWYASQMAHVGRLALERAA